MAYHILEWWIESMDETVRYDAARGRTQSEQIIEGRGADFERASR